MSNNETRAQEMALKFRTDHGLGSGPIHDLIGVITQHTNYDVTVMNAPENEHGLTLHDPKRNATIIGIATSAHPMRQRSTLAHELGHALFGDFSQQIHTHRSPEEIRADAFARHLLIPQQGLANLLKELQYADKESLLSSVTQAFLVSPAIAWIALRDLKVLDAHQDANLKTWTTKNLAVKYGWADQYTALQAIAQQPRAPQKLLRRALVGHHEEVVSIETLATLWQKPKDEIEKLLEKISDYRAQDGVAQSNPR